LPKIYQFWKGIRLLKAYKCDQRRQLYCKQKSSSSWWHWYWAIESSRRGYLK